MTEMSRFNLMAWLCLEDEGFHNWLRFPFTVLSWIYGVVIRLRLLFYTLGLLPRKKVDCRVISVGNITVGGTGKTPMTIHLAEQWRKRGVNVGIVSRGYGRKKKDAVILVSDGLTLLETAESVGDEPILMAERLEGVPLVVSADRYKGCQSLLQNFKLELILLDDGFQHLRLHRDQNLLLIDASNPFGNTRILPRGLLREPLSEIHRADHVVITRSDSAEDISSLSLRLERFGRPVLKSRFEATEVLECVTDDRYPLAELKGRMIVAFCGVGNPGSFFNQLTQLGAELKATKAFGDHHHYTLPDVLSVCTRAREVGADWVVTTEKDAVKIKALQGFEREAVRDCRIFTLRIGVKFLDQSEEEKLLFS